MKRKSKPIAKNKVLVSLIIALAVTPLHAQYSTNSATPKLVIGITIDQLRSDYLQMMQQLFGERGFKRLMNEGLVYENVEYGFPDADGTAATAAIYTGTTPSYNGIIASTCYNTANQRVENILFDREVMGNYTDETVSPKKLLTSTFCDELKIASHGKSDIFAIAPDCEEAIISAGHLANGAFWIDNTKGRWATTTFYKAVPQYIENFNQTNSLAQTIGSQEWVPFLPFTQYKAIPGMERDFSFKYDFSRMKEEKFKAFKTSGLINEEINKLAKIIIERGNLGKKEYADFLSLNFSAVPFQGKSVQELSVEIQDIYVRLDRAIADLLDFVDLKVGLKNTVIFVTSTGYFSGEGKEIGEVRLPTGEFYPNRAVSLLNMYLMALYGEVNWVEGYHDGQIFLNRKQIADKLISIEDIQTKAAEFLIQMTGVQDVVTSHAILVGNSRQLEEMRRGFHRKLSGDLLVEIQPGWEIVYEDLNNTREYVHQNAITTPLFFFGRDIKPEHVYGEIQICQIAPTISRILRIRSPNAATGKVLPEIFN